VSVGHIVLAFRDKYFPDGTFNESKARIALADVADKQSQTNFYARCASSFGDRLSTQIAVQFGREQTIVDVNGTYYQGWPH
jgi:hypothetical protein